MNGDPVDNPNMTPIRRIIAGILVYHRFEAGKGRKGWNAPTRIAWSSKVDRIIQEMKTLRNGDQFGITHAGCTAWKSPTFFLTTPTVRKLPQPSEELSKMKESIRLQKIKVRRLEKRQGLVEEDDDSDSDDPDHIVTQSASASEMSEDPPDNTPSSGDNTLTLQAVQQLFKDRDSQLEQRLLSQLTQLLSKTMGTPLSVAPAPSAGLHSGGFNSHNPQNHE